MLYDSSSLEHKKEAFSPEALHKELTSEINGFFVRMDPFGSYQARVKSLHKAAKEVVQRRKDSYGNIMTALDARLKEEKRALVRIQKLPLEEKRDPLLLEIGLYSLERFLEDLAHITGYSSKEIRTMEAFQVWRETKRQEQSTAIQVGTHTFTIREEPLSCPLTSAQRTEFLRIFSDEVPKWFSDLPESAQTYLKTTVPKLMMDEEGWKIFYSSVPPSLNRKFPLLTNTWLQEVSNGDETLMGSIRMGVPVPYGMHHPDEMRNNTQFNMEQMVDVWQKKIGLPYFEDYWGLKPADTDHLIQQDVLFIPYASLLSSNDLIKKRYGFFDKNIANTESNTRMTRTLEGVVQHCNRIYRGHYSRIVFMRTAVNKMGVPGRFEGAEEFFKYAKTLAEQLKTKRNNLQPDGSKEPEEKEDTKRDYDAQLDWMEETIEWAQGEINSSTVIQGRNKNVFLAAVLEVCAISLGLIPIGNCKSSKDRKGTEMMYVEAIRLYYKLYKKFPSYADEAKERQNFVELLSRIYLSGHHHEIASQNAPDSKGIKDFSNLMDSDVLDVVGETVSLTDFLAKLNKPGFMKDVLLKKAVRWMWRGWGVSVALIVLIALVAPPAVFFYLGAWVVSTGIVATSTAVLWVGASVMMALCALVPLGFSLGIKGKALYRQHYLTFDRYYTQWEKKQPLKPSSISQSAAAASGFSEGSPFTHAHFVLASFLFLTLLFLTALLPVASSALLAGKAAILFKAFTHAKIGSITFSFSMLSSALALMGTLLTTGALKWLHTRWEQQRKGYKNLTSDVSGLDLSSSMEGGADQNLLSDSVPLKNSYSLTAGTRSIKKSTASIPPPPLLDPYTLRAADAHGPAGGK